MTTGAISGQLERPGGVRLYWERYGRGPVPAVFLHGGPGSGINDFYRTFFNEGVHSALAFDQRGCGRSTPSVRDDLASLTDNTTQTLIEDIEALRRSGALRLERLTQVQAEWTRGRSHLVCDPPLPREDPGLWGLCMGD